jgi:hypothetical protein
MLQTHLFSYLCDNFLSNIDKSSDENVKLVIHILIILSKNWLEDGKMLMISLLLTVVKLFSRLCLCSVKNFDNLRAAFHILNQKTLKVERLKKVNEHIQIQNSY